MNRPDPAQALTVGDKLVDWLYGLRDRLELEDRRRLAGLLCGIAAHIEQPDSTEADE